MSNVLNRTTLQYQTSVNTPDFPVVDWIINPDLSAVQGVDKKYWVVDGDSIRQMTTVEKDANIDLWKAEHQKTLLRALLGYGESKIPSAQLSALRDEYLVAKIENRTTAVAYLKPWVDFDVLVTTEYKNRRGSIATATTHDQVYAVSVDFSNLDISTPVKVSISDARLM